MGYGGTIARRREIVCRCKAYSFPHRFTGGACTPLQWVRRFFAKGYGTAPECSRCNCLNGPDCSVDTGQESAQYCEALADFANFNELRINWKRQ